MERRAAVVAGSFYSSNSVQLSNNIDELLVHTKPIKSVNIKAIIVPHAGYIYSGPIAASAYGYIKGHRFKRAIIIGPSHRVAFTGIACTQYSHFETPLGLIPVDVDACDLLVSNQLAVCLERAHQWEHSLEVQLPFIQKLFSSLKILPLVVGDATKQQVCDLINAVYQVGDILIISTDLSHYLNYNEAKKTDENTSTAITQFEANLTGDMACGCRGLNGFLQYAKQHEWSIECVDLRNSGDTAGDKDRVVGYGAYIVY